MHKGNLMNRFADGDDRSPVGVISVSIFFRK